MMTSIFHRGSIGNYQNLHCQWQGHTFCNSVLLQTKIHKRAPAIFLANISIAWVLISERKWRLENVWIFMAWCQTEPVEAISWLKSAHSFVYWRWHASADLTFHNLILQLYVFSRKTFHDFTQKPHFQYNPDLQQTSLFVGNKLQQLLNF